MIFLCISLDFMRAHIIYRPKKLIEREDVLPWTALTPAKEDVKRSRILSFDMPCIKCVH